jgi:NAD(P)-dependent dehydrogenase (short-subunit alcohol dehydrogenase family)
MAHPHWTLERIREQIPDQTGRRAIVTGANSGIGFYTALELARKGASVVMASRDRGRVEAARDRVLGLVAGARVEAAVLDLASLASIHAFAAAQTLPLDLLINNAGVMTPPKRLETADGLELQFGTNVVGHFALTALLFPCLSEAAGSPRVVTVSSIAHKSGRLNFGDLQSTRSYNPMRAYQQSKLADLIFAIELERRLRATGSRIVSVAAHPGVAPTNLFVSSETRPLQRWARGKLMRVMGLLLNSEAGGAVPTLYAATAAAAEGGGYYGPQGFMEMRGNDAGPAKIAPQARERAAAEQLWNICEDLSGIPLLDVRHARIAAV